MGYSSKNILYYSTSTYLAYFIARNFYNDIHYVWCSPVYDPSILDEFDARKKIPPSSSPHKIYSRLTEDILSNDMHSSKIEENKSGLRKGAVAKLAEGAIDDDEFAKINYLIDNAMVSDFRPMLFLIPKYLVDTKIRKVKVSEMANPLSEEYLIIDLLANEFEIIRTN